MKCPNFDVLRGGAVLRGSVFFSCCERSDNSVTLRLSEMSSTETCGLLCELGDTSQLICQSG